MNLRPIICAIVGHDYFLIQRLTAHSRKIGCHRCRGVFGMNDDARAVIPWSADLEAVYRIIGVLPRWARTEVADDHEGSTCD